MQIQVISDPRGFFRFFVNGVLFVALPLLVFIPFLVLAYQRKSLGPDFESFMLPAARKIAEGGSPYPGYEYPPLVAFALVPFTVLPGPNIIYIAFLIACVPLSLWFLGVRDWRCYGIVFLWTPILTGVQSGNVTLPLLLGASICWHYRERWKLAALAGGLAVAAKLLCLPLVVWLAATRRFKAAIGVGVVAAGVSFVLWSVIGFSGVAGYPSRLSAVSETSAPESYTLKVLLLDIGVGAGPARAAWAFVAIAVVAGAVWFGWRGDDRRSFALVGLVMIVGSPITWMHSFVLLLIPVAVMRPKLSVSWFLPCLLLFAPGTGNGAPWQTAGLLAVAALTATLALVPQDGQSDDELPVAQQPLRTAATSP